MKIQQHLILTLIISTLSITSSSAQAVAAGSGYCKDMQQLAANVCYNSEISSISDKQSVAKLQTSVSYEDI